MALVPYTVTALAESDADGTDGKNIVAGAVVSLLDDTMSAVLLYDDAAGLNPSTTKTTGANGQVVIYAEQGNYTLSVNGVESKVSVVSYSGPDGVDGWDAEQEYYQGALVIRDSRAWQLNAASSVGDEPSGSSVIWSAIKKVNVVDVSEFALGDGSDQSTEIAAAVTHWNSLLTGSFGDQYPSATATALYFPSGVWSAPGLEILPTGTGALIYGDGITSQLDGISIDLSQYRTNLRDVLLRGAKPYGLRLSDTFGAGPKGTQVMNVWIRDGDVGLQLIGDLAWCNLVDIYLEKNGRNVELISTLGAHLTNVIAVNSLVDHNWYVEGGGEMKCVNCLGMNAAQNNLYIKGSTAKNAVEHYFTQCTFTNAQKTRVLTISSISDAGGGQINIQFSSGHELVANMTGLDVAGTSNYNGTYDIDEVVSADTIRVTAAYVSDETAGSANLPNWDVFIDVEAGDPIIRTNDMFFVGGNINYLKINRGFNINFDGTRLKNQIWLGEVNRVRFNRSGRGRNSDVTTDIPIGGAATGWAELVMFDEVPGANPGDAGISLRAPDNSAGLIGNVAARLNTVTVREDSARLEALGRAAEVNSRGVQITNMFSGRIPIGDDEVHVFVPPDTRGTIRVGPATPLAAFQAWHTFRAESGGGLVQKIAGGANADAASGALTGTTGADGNVTVSASTDGNIYIENRTGGALNFYYIIEGGV